MFTNARLKLTSSYMLILMVVSLLFSAVIYHVVTQELERGFHRAELRFRTRDFGFRLPIPSGMRIFQVEDVENAKREVLQRLAVLNVFILGVSAVASYIMAGRTLTPIQEALEEQKRFIADASHELSTPLTALKTSLEVALRDKKMTSAGAHQVMKDSLGEVDELASLSQNLLTLARYEKNNHRVVFTRVDLTDVISDVTKRLSPLAKKKNIAFHIEPGNYVVTADEASLNKLLTILIDNAIKYTAYGGRVEVTASILGKKLIIKVTDTGSGISKEELSHIFDRFYRSDASRTKGEVVGYGLGLSIARRIVDLHQGDISVKSQIGKGSAFIVTLPITT